MAHGCVNAQRLGRRGADRHRIEKVVASVPLGKGPGFPLFSPDSSTLYVMNSGQGDVAVIDVAAARSPRATRSGSTRLAEPFATFRRHFVHSSSR